MKFSSEVVERYSDVVEIDGQKFGVIEVIDVLYWLGNRIDTVKLSAPLKDYLLSKGIMKKHDWGGFIEGYGYKAFVEEFFTELRKFNGEY